MILEICQQNQRQIQIQRRTQRQIQRQRQEKPFNRKVIVFRLTCSLEHYICVDNSAYDITLHKDKDKDKDSE